jgi:hypothetical protein
MFAIFIGVSVYFRKHVRFILNNYDFIKVVINLNTLWFPFEFCNQLRNLMVILPLNTKQYDRYQPATS